MLPVGIGVGATLRLGVGSPSAKVGPGVGVELGATVGEADGAGLGAGLSAGVGTGVGAGAGGRTTLYEYASAEAVVSQVLEANVEQTEI